MSIYDINNIAELIRDNSYVGRGIVIGKSADGKNAVSAYFIMGRSANSRNRVFVERDGVLYTEPFDASKVEDPSLIIYAAQRRFENKLIVTNGDQTDTIYDGLINGKCFKGALKSRAFEPDAPNFTPRISGILEFENNDFTYEMSILKSADEKGTACNRYTFSYEPLNGLGHFIHTYIGDGNPLPTFLGEPERIAIPNDIDEFTDSLWDALNHDNRISLYVRYTNLENGQEVNRLINQNKAG
ncbi:MAG: IMP cyclohydrolase [Clostridia bacterium]|nr:IMP cyclohydrolase [Clostridia bacterium]